MTPEKTRETTPLSPDRPLSDPADDALGYAPFAHHLARSILKMAPVEGLVLAVNGQWGSGKSTAINFILHYLNEAPDDERPVVVQFNPWWFSGREDLTRQFFNQLEEVLEKRGLVSRDTIRRMHNLGDFVSQVPLPVAPWAKLLAYITQRAQEITSLKGQIAKDLRQQKRKIVLVADDIDRLTSEEIRHFFAAIKGIADFPNVVYLLAFDSNVVVDALAKEGVLGHEYLEKIVQVTFPLPLPDTTSLHGLLFEKLNAVLANVPEESFDQVYWGNTFHEGIARFIDTPRDVARFINMLQVTFPAVEGEVNPVDFLAMEALRVFVPTVYEVIRRNPDSFAGVRERGATHAEEEGLKTFHESWLNEVAERDRDSVQRMLKRIFPRLQSVWGGTTYGSNFLGRWRRELRVCSPDIFPVYFRLGWPEGALSTMEMQAIVALAGDQDAFSAKLAELAKQKRPDGRTRARAFLERFEDYTGELPRAVLPSAIKALLDLGDDLIRPEDASRGLFDLGSDIIIDMLIRQMSVRLEPAERFGVYVAGMKEGHGVSAIVTHISLLGQQHGKYGRDALPEEERFVTAEQLAELESMGLEKIREAARENRLLDNPDLPHILFRWKDWDEEGVKKRWLPLALVDDANLAKLLERFLSKRTSHTVGDMVGRVRYRLDPKSLEPFLDPKEIIDRVRRLTNTPEIADVQKIAARQFVKEYEMREKGKDPDSPSAWFEEDVLE